MKFQILISEKNNKSISICCLLKILHRVLGVKATIFTLSIRTDKPTEQDVSSD